MTTIAETQETFAGLEGVAPAAPRPISRCEYFTPVWAAQALYEAHFSDLDASDLVLEPTCGPGRMLRVVPSHVPAVGCELRPELADQARRCTGRPILVGDVLKLPLPPGVTAVLGNPPFSTVFFDALMRRLAGLLPDGARAGFILPAYFTQTPRTVLRWHRSWTIQTEILPRTLFRGLSKPLIFGLFTRDPAPRLRGLRLFEEADAIAQLAEESRRELETQSGTWRQAVLRALRRLGGQAALPMLYEAMARRRPHAGNGHWREKIRQTLGRGPFVALGGGNWAVDETRLAA